MNDLSELLFEFDLEERVWALEKFGYKLLSFKENKNSFKYNKYIIYSLSGYADMRYQKCLDESKSIFTKYNV